MTTDERTGRTATTNSSWKVVREVVILVVVAVGLAVVVKTSFVQAFYIPSGSMEPGLEVNDRILVEKPSYWGGGGPQRGDIIVFADPGDWLDSGEDSGPTSTLGRALAKIGLYPSGGHLVKRVVGVAGDVVECCDEDGRLTVNGTPLPEDSFIDQQDDCDGPMAGCAGWSATVPAGKLFVMGDNRDESADSSFHLCTADDGPDCDEDDAFVSTDLVVGKVVALVWPLGRAHVLHRPDTFADVADVADPGKED